MKFLLDTNILSEVMKQSPDPRVVDWFSRIDHVATSVICIEELVFGLRRRSLFHKESWLHRLLADKGVVYPTSEQAAQWSGEQRSMLQSRGITVHQADALIAACAWEHGLVLATRNTRDFEPLGIALFNPFSSN